jgi:DNA-binding GntR family transcriptional regulator
MAAVRATAEAEAAQRRVFADRLATLQVARAIEAEIRAGQWTPGNAVPSRNQLAERFGIARETAARAHAWLARAGYLVAVPGVGMVVTPVTRWPEEPSN